MDETTTFEATAQAGRKGKWRVSLEPDALTLSAVDGDESLRVTREEAEERIELRPAPLLGVLLTLVIAKKKIVFSIAKADAESVRQWRGPPTVEGLRIALKRRLRWCLPIGILFAVTSIPLPANPEAGIDAMPFDPVSLALGVSLVVISLLSRIRPQRIFFLLDGVWLMMLAFHVTLRVFRGGSAWWFVLVVVLILAAKGASSEQQRFATLPTQDHPKVTS